MLHRLKNAVNKCLRPLNVRLETLTAERAADRRLAELERSGRFGVPVFPLLPGMREGSLDWVAEAARAHATGLAALMSGRAEPGRFDPANEYLRGSDAEMLYLVVRTARPSRVVEVGVGNSTRVIRQAVADGALAVDHFAIDPEPRTAVAGMSSELIEKRLEELDDEERKRVFSRLGKDDVLFIDSSHEVRPGNDVVELFCNILPSLPPGVLVHVHDVFLPFDYPRDFAWNMRSWNEQYLLQVFLAAGGREVLWPGYYVRECRQQDFRRIPFSSGHGIRPQSLWFRS